jgi:hypothetical protein
MSNQTTRLERIEGQVPHDHCRCLSALGILRGFLFYGSMEEAQNAPACLVCGRTPLEAAKGHSVKLYLGLDTEAV